MVRADSAVGRILLAARPRRPLVRVSVSPWWAKVLMAAGAQASPPVDSMIVEFDGDAVERAGMLESAVDAGGGGDVGQRIIGDSRLELTELERALGLEVAHAVLERALTHRSYAGEHELLGNERLEFLGDAVLGFVISETLFRRRPDLSEGQLAKERAAIINMRSLAAVARDLNLGRYILLGRGEETAGGRDKSSILADTLEALIGAVHLDQGGAASSELIDRLFGSFIESPETAVMNEVSGDSASTWNNIDLSVLRDRLLSTLNMLSEREADIVSMRYGLAGGRPRTADEISEIYGVTREHIHRIESKAMSRVLESEHGYSGVESSGGAEPTTEIEDRQQTISTIAAPAGRPSPLTPREREIAELIARGLSNKGIADQLGISPATVTRHVANIVKKLGFVSRAQIAASATSQRDDAR
jgi:DNA-binding CsgD family transcriptional regulator